MKWLFGLVVLSLALASVSAQNLDDEYVQIFNLIQEADGLSGVHPSQALAKYLEAQKGLQQLHNGSPDWNPKVVAYRLSYVAAKIAALAPQASVAGTPAEKGTNTPAAVSAPAPATGAPGDWEAQLNAIKEETRQLQADKAVLEAKLKEALAMRPAESDPRELARAEEKVKALQKENDLLKVAADDAKAKAAAPGADTKALETARQALAESNRQLAQQKEMNSKLTLEKEALESRVKQLGATTVGSAALASVGDETSQVKQLARERDALQKQLDAANKQLYGRKGKGAAARVDELENQVSVLSARLEVLEARRIPYSTEELALFKQPDTQLAASESKPVKKVVHELPPGSAALVMEAQKDFAARQYDKAEEQYLQVLKLDPKNVKALDNLAAIQIEEKHFEDAERNLKQALAVDPEDSYGLYVLGRLKFQQGNFDDALDALSHAAKIDPQDAEIQNHLGLVLSQKGMRGPAEAALRKAVELQPGYAGAHHNLAVFYLTQQPRYPALARWHYQKALAAGEPRSPDLEKLLEENK